MMKNIPFGSIIKEYTVRAKKDINYPVCSVTNVNGVQKSSDTFSKQVFSNDLSKYKKAFRNSFVYSPPRINVGSIACQNIEDCVLVSPLYITFNVDLKFTSIDFVSLFFKSNYFRNYVKEHTQGSVRANFKMSEMSKLCFPSISKQEQECILKEINIINGVIRKDQELVSLFDEMIISKFIELFGDPNQNHSNMIKIGDVGVLRSGGTPSRSRPEYFKGTIRWFSAGELNSLYLNDSIEHYFKGMLAYQEDERRRGVKFVRLPPRRFDRAMV